MTTFIYPGSFDPFTKGHLDIAVRAARLCDKLHIVVVHNSQKKSAFSPAERCALIEACIADYPNISVRAHSGLVVDYYSRCGAQAAVRGMRTAEDFVDEARQVMANRLIEPDYEVLWLPCRPEMTYNSSTIVKELAAYGAAIDDLVPAAICEQVQERLAPANKEQSK